MSVELWKMRRLAAEAYLHALAGYDRLAIHGHSGPREFRRAAVVASTQKQNGITIGARLQVEAFRRAGVEAELLDATPALRNPRFRIGHTAATCYVFHSGGPQLASMLASVLPHAADAWRVAYWAWELPNPPLRWPEPKGLVDEIWTPSAYARASLLKRFDVPVRVVPHVVVPPDTRPARKAPRPFTVLTLADSRSSFRRKNPAGAIRAFARAFGNTNAAKLIVKLNGNSAIDEILHKEAQGLENIEVIDRFLDDAALRALFCSADVLLSLHRAEGFGIPMLEAMALGVPVIATGWSGNLDFMNHSNSVLIPVHLVPVDDDSVYFRYHDSVWAEPDEAAAADALRQLQADPDRLDRLSQQAFDDARAWAQGWTIPQ